MFFVADFAPNPVYPGYAKLLLNLSFSLMIRFSNSSNTVISDIAFELSAMNLIKFGSVQDATICPISIWVGV